MKLYLRLLPFCLFLLPLTLSAQTQDLGFVTLGTASGPIAIADRSQPANALLMGKDVYLIDAGDGANGQLARAGIPTGNLKGLFISHLHFDHTGGVLGVIALRAQLNNPAPFAIYGPPGTRDFTEGLLAAMEPALTAGFGLPGQSWQTHITVHELRNGEVVELEGIKVTVAENNHYESVVDTSNTPGFISLSYRFDSQNRSIVFTGDTGASEAVVNLALNADLLVSEMMDIDITLANLGFPVAGPDQNSQSPLERHFRTHHMTPAQVANMASAANAGKLVVTHFAPGISSLEQEQEYRKQISEIYKGAISFANDLDRF